MRKLAILAAAFAALALPGGALALDANPIDGVWKGAYECGQGSTGLTLTLEGNADGTITGSFEFYPRPNNPYVATGSFQVRGYMSDGYNFTLNGSQWISQPYNYSMVNLSGRITREKEGGPLLLFGNVLGASGCTQFYADKQ